ncbi:hypothetical protein CRYUN_Cryun01aG0074500 [Craigia yunnanensis]
MATVVGGRRTENGRKEKKEIAMPTSLLHIIIIIPSEGFIWPKNTFSNLIELNFRRNLDVPRCHLRRNLVTKTHNPTFKAANPVVQYEACALASSPSQLHRNWASKRDKTFIATYPINIEYSTGIPEYTEIIIETFSDQVLKLDHNTFWKGSRANFFEKAIPNDTVRRFTHQADSGEEIIGSVGGLEYLIGENIKWIIAWSNTKNEINKVYTQILQDEVVNWNEIKDNLDKSGPHYKIVKSHYSSDIVIDPASATPTVQATV